MSQAQPQLIIERIYLKDVSYEAPNTPSIFQINDWQPEPTLDLHYQHTPVMEHVYEVMMTLTVMMKHSNKTAFVIEVKQCGIFTIDGYSEEHLQQILGIVAPGIIYPYAREAVADLVRRGGFPQLNLAPINFEAMYLQKVGQDANEEVNQPVVEDDIKH